MTKVAAELLNEALKLIPSERVALVDELLSSLDKPDSKIDALWAKEAEERLKAFQEGKIKSISYEDVLNELENN